MRIDNLVDPPKIFPELTYDLHVEICEQIPMTYRTISRLNRTGLQLAKAYVLIKARRFAYKGQSVSGALKYIHRLETEGHELVKEGFLLPARMRSLQDLHHYLSPRSKKGESLLHFAASKGLLKVIDYAVTVFPYLINRKLFGKTAVQLASEQGNTKVIRRLMEKGADMEGTQSASIYLDSWILRDIFAYLTTPKGLLTVSRVSKAWHTVSKENHLWEPIYRTQFPKAIPTSTDNWDPKLARFYATGNWQTKLARFYSNAPKGLYVEEIVPHSTNKGKIKNVLMADHYLLLLFENGGTERYELLSTVLPQKIELSQSFQGVAHLSRSILVARHGSHVSCLLLHDPKEIFEVDYPHDVVNCTGMGDQMIVQLQNGSL